MIEKDVEAAIFRQGISGGRCGLCALSRPHAGFQGDLSMGPWDQYGPWDGPIVSPKSNDPMTVMLRYGYKMGRYQTCPFG